MSSLAFKFPEEFLDKSESRYIAPFVWWILCGLLPYLSLLFEFGNEGRYFAQIYPHFFLYPLLIAFFIIFCLIPPLRFVLKIKAVNKNIYIIILLISLIGASYITWADVTEGDPAIWELRRALELELPEGTPLITEMHYLLEECPSIGSDLEANSPNELIKNCNERRRNLATYIRNNYPQEDRSITHFLYIVSLFIQTTTIGFSVLFLGSLVVYKARWKLDVSSVDRLVAFIFFFYVLWIPIRLLALQEKANLYLDVTFLTELPVTLIILICYVYSLVLTWQSSKDFTVHILQIIVGGVLFSVAILYPHILLQMFGRNSTPATYPIISIVLFLGVAPWIIITQNKLYEEEVPIPIEVNKTRYYRLENIRVLLNEGFTSEELRRLCHDVPNFREVYDKLAQSTGKAEIIDYLIEYANRKLQFEALLDWAKEHNPIRYEKHQPYYEVNQEHD